ncbi:MAG: hypothetical protein WBA63_09855 [Thermomicrobiales bacterium]
MSADMRESVIALAGEHATWFAATQTGLLVSRDAGTTWGSAFAAEPGLEGVPVSAVAVSPTFAEDRVVFAAIPGGIGRSDDGGETWRFVRLSLPAPLVTALALSPDVANGGLAFAATLQDGMLRSEDGGASWTAWNSGLFTLSVQALSLSPRFAVDGTIVAGTSAGLYRSTNGGRRWQPVGPSDSLPTVLALAACSSDGEHAHYLAGTEEHGLWRSEDGGGSWHACDLPLSSGAIHAIAGSGEPSHCGHLALLGDNALLTSTDGGMSWKPALALPRSLNEVSAIARDGADVLLGTVDSSILRMPSDRHS